MGKMLIKSAKKSNLLDALVYLMKVEKIEYEITDNLNTLDETITNIIYIDEDKNIEDLAIERNIPIVLISDTKNIISNEKLTINYLITNLVNNKDNYTNVQKEYLFKRGIYHVFLQKVNELVNNYENYNGLIYDLTEIKSKPDNWIFKFDSINDTYSWLSKMNRNTSNRFVQKIVSFYSDKVYDDSVKEINYLTEKITNIRNNKNIIDIFILTKEELAMMKKNYFFKALLKNISSNYRLYFIDKEEIMDKDSELLNQLKDGIIIYEDCIYRDTYSDELSLGFVDCKKETWKKYNEYFDYMIENYGQKLNSKGDVDEL